MPPRRRALIFLVVLLALAGLAIVLLSAPAGRHLYLTGELDRFTLPKAVELEIPQAVALHLRNMDLRFSRATKGPRDFAIRASRAQPAGTAHLKPAGRRGLLTVTIPRGSVLQGASKSVQYTPGAGDALKISLEADRVEVVEANRVTVEPPFWNAEGTLTVANPDEMVHLDAECREECSFDLADDEFSSVPEDGSIPVDAGQTVTLPAFRVKEAVLRKVKDADLTTARASEITFVTARGFAWTVVTAKGSSIVISGRGEVSSLRQDGREVLPSRAADLLDAAPATRGVYGGATLLVVLAWGLLFKRSLDILVKAILPD